ncbi:hypothetical protein ACHAPI_001665 [Fusarium lateritium]
MPLQKIEPWVPASQEEEVQQLDFTCGECAQHFVNSGLLLRHYRQEHITQGTPRPWEAVAVNHIQQQVDEEHWNSPARRPWVCDREPCEDRFRTKKALRRHQKFAHDKFRAFACDECAFTSANNIQLAIHQATVHRGEKDFVCPECGEAFGQDSTRDTHVRTMHSDSAAIECDECGEMIANSREMVVHKNRAHPWASKVTCSVCGFNTQSNAALQVHMAVHSDEKRFVCRVPRCGKAYKNKGSLARHLKKAH